jgi:ribose/xylose/arabinose/galactoside ABC-type transport system permease subunit
VQEGEQRAIYVTHGCDTGAMDPILTLVLGLLLGLVLGAVIGLLVARTRRTTTDPRI